MTPTESNPHSSAARAMAARSDPIRIGPSGQVKSGTCSPIFKLAPLQPSFHRRRSGVGDALGSSRTAPERYVTAEVRIQDTQRKGPNARFSPRCLQIRAPEQLK